MDNSNGTWRQHYASSANSTKKQPKTSASKNSVSKIRDTKGWLFGLKDVFFLKDPSSNKHRNLFFSLNSVWTCQTAFSPLQGTAHRSLYCILTLKFSFALLEINIAQHEQAKMYQNKSGDFITGWSSSWNYIEMRFVWRCSVYRLDLPRLQERKRQRLPVIRLHLGVRLLFCLKVHQHAGRRMRHTEVFWCTLVVTVIIYEYYLFMWRSQLLLLHFPVDINCPDRDREAITQVISIDCI